MTTIPATWKTPRPDPQAIQGTGWLTLHRPPGLGDAGAAAAAAQQLPQRNMLNCTGLLSAEGGPGPPAVRWSRRTPP